MDEPPSAKKVVRFRLTPGRAQDIIRKAAAETGNVQLSSHALVRMAEREISDIEVYRLLRTGHVMEEPTKTERDEWKCKVVKQLKGNREAGVVTIILHNGKLFVATVEWEDWRQ